MTIALTHWAITRACASSPQVARLLDGTPLILLEGKTWRGETMRRMRIGDADVMNMARDHGLKTLDDIDTATLERNGEISIIPMMKGDDDASDENQSSQEKDRGAAMTNTNASDPDDRPCPVGDTVPKVDNSVAVGEDLAFQRRWWKFENVVWSFFALVLVADISGLLGNGLLAHIHAETPSHALRVQYDRIAVSAIGNGGSTYVFPALGGDSHVEFGL